MLAGLLSEGVLETSSKATCRFHGDEAEGRPGACSIQKEAHTWHGMITLTVARCCALRPGPHSYTIDNDNFRLKAGLYKHVLRCLACIALHALPRFLIAVLERKSMQR